MPINRLTRGTQIPIAPAETLYVPLSAVSFLGGFRTPAAEHAAPSLKRPASETLPTPGRTRVEHIGATSAPKSGHLTDMPRQPFKLAFRVSLLLPPLQKPWCVQSDARSLSFMHNHPSGDPTPSQADIQMTKRSSISQPRSALPCTTTSSQIPQRFQGRPRRRLPQCKPAKPTDPSCLRTAMTASTWPGMPAASWSWTPCLKEPATTMFFG